MERFSFLHAADLHLDTPFDGLAARRPALAEALRDASLEALSRLVDAAIARRVDCVLLAGDLYDGPVRGLRAQLHFRRGVERLADAGIATFVVHGNHDPVEEGWTAVRSWPERVHVFAPGEVEVVPVVREGRTIALVHGTSFRRREERENLARRFRRRPEFAGPQVGLLHCNVEGQRGHDPYAPCTVEDLRAAGLDYWALGHVHQAQVLLREPCLAVYAGNLQGRSLKPSERGPKGAFVARFHGGRFAEPELVPLGPVRFEGVSVAIDGLDDWAALERAIVAAVPEASGCDGLVLELRLEGRGPLHGELLARQDELCELLDEATEGRAPWIHWARAIVATAPAVDAGALAGRDDLLGLVLRRLEGLRADPEARAALLAGIDAELPAGLAARGAGEGAVERAAARAIERLGGEP